MYKAKIDEYFEKNKKSMLDDICRLIEIRSVREKERDGMPFGEGPAKALEVSLGIAAGMGFEVRNFSNSPKRSFRISSKRMKHYRTGQVEPFLQL